MIKVQGKEVSGLTDVELKLVRTYKGEIKRTQAGIVSAFPTSFITPGFDFAFVGPREDMIALEQIFLSNDLVTLEFDFGGTALKGKFSCTTNQKTEANDRGNSHLNLSISVVSDGSAITAPDGGAFVVKYGETVVKDDCSFGKVYTMPTAYRSKKANGYTLPGGKLLILGDVELTD